MPDPLLILDEVVEMLAATRPVRLAVIVERHGSAPRGAGAMLLIRGDGSSAGSVGGGRIELLTSERLQEIQQDGSGCLCHFNLLPELDGMPCGGQVTILVARLAITDINCFYAAAKTLSNGERCRLYAVIKQGGAVSWQLEPSVPAADQLCSFTLHPAPRLLICGAGHISRSLAVMARDTGFSVTVMDDRRDFLAANPFPYGIQTIALAGFSGCLEDARLSRNCFLVIATCDHRYDLTVLEQALQTAAGYIGIVGSRRKRAELFDTMSAAGTAEASLLRVHCPVGLPIGAETPAEIAVSILAEMISINRTKT